MPTYDQTGIIQNRRGNRSDNNVPRNAYKTKDGRWVAIACTSDKIFARLAEAMGEPELASEDRWGLIATRAKNRAEVDAHVGRWTSSRDRGHLLELCERFQVPCGPVYAIDEIFEDPQYKARGNIAFVEDERTAGTVAIPNVVPRLSDTPGGITSLGPPLGAHNGDVYEGLLGLTAGEIAAFKAKGVV